MVDMRTVSPQGGRRRVGSFYFAAIVCFILAFCVAVGVSGCSDEPEPISDSEATTGETLPQASSDDPTDVSVVSMTGPTSMGLLDLMEKSEEGETTDAYDFSIVGTADEVVTKVVSGDADIALVPANVASVLWNKTEGKISVVDINTLSVLYLVTANPEITNFDAIAGKTLYLTGKGTTPDYVTQFLVREKNLSDVKLEFKSEASEVAALLSSDPDAIAVLPQPFVAAAIQKNPSLKAVVNLGDVWKEVAPAGSELVTGVTIVQNSFAEEHPEALVRFVEGQTQSVDAVLADPAAFAQLVVDKGIIQNAQVAEEAIGQCSLVCISGPDMKTALESYLDVLCSFDPASVGGSLPEASFYRTEL